MKLDMLNPQQRKAAETLNGPVLILAGAGSGKTRALTYRVANLISTGVEPWRILAITFTNKAAKEMQARIVELVGDKAEDVWVSTFHAMCARILRRDIEKLGYKRSFSIYDEDDQKSMLKNTLKSLDIDDKSFTIRELKVRISDAKNRLLTPDEWFRESAKDFRCQQIHDIFTEYEKRLRSANALDFDDLLMRTLELFADHPPVLKSYQQRFSHVLVDEYQDTNYAQYKLVNLLTQESRNLCVVGDDDQSIYSWRGADMRNILEFEKDYPEATVIKLEQNYRSTSNILDAANQVIQNNQERKAKKLWTDAPEGELISLFCAGDEREEAAWICDRIQQLQLSGEKYSDIAVLYRTNAQSRVLEEMLMRAGIPYRVFGGVRFYDRKEIKDIIAYLRCIVNPSDDISLRRIINQPKRSIGESTIRELLLFAEKDSVPLYSALMDVPDTLSARPRKCVREFGELMGELVALHETVSLSEFVDVLIERTGLRAQYEKDLSDEAKTRLENMDEFLGAVREFEQAADEPTLENYLENVALITDLDQAEIGTKHITLMTVHSAKGLEFHTVFIAGLEEGVFPSGRSILEDNRLEEERRLCYVAITRAKENLYISYAMQRMLYNQLNMNALSRFVDEIPKGLIDDAWISKREQNFPEEEAKPQPAHKQSEKKQSHKPLTFGVPQIVTRGAGIGARSSALGIKGVKKGFTPSAAAGVPASALASLFKVGDRVMHKKFGEGNVMDIHGKGSDSRIVISFAAYGIKEFALCIAPIVKVND
ncbi:MAG: DNA helicase PcrA [Clostridiales bacterium]|nr:DNA helicase PcrA [Clostridiales bacterium]